MQGHSTNYSVRLHMCSLRPPLNLYCNFNNLTSFLPCQVSVGSVFDNTSVLLPSWQRHTLEFLNSISFLVFSTAVTLIAIFESDLRLAATPASVDSYFTVLASVVFVEFLLELVRVLVIAPDAFYR